MAIRMGLNETTASVIGAVCLLLAGSAHATLGGARGTVEADRSHLSARLSALPSRTYTVEVLTLANGGVVREYVRGDGAVFAVAWRGPARPDLRQLLGNRFDVVQADNILPGGRRTRRPLAVRRPDFIVHSGGHSGAFWGVAYLPLLAPPGFSASELH